MPASLSFDRATLVASLPAAMTLAKATLVLVAALGITSVLRRASAGARHLIWLAAMGALLALPALEAWAPWQLAILPSAFATTTVAPSLRAEKGVNAERVMRGVQSRQPSRANVEPQSSGLSTPGTTAVTRVVSAWAAVLVLWAAVALVVAGWLAHAAFSVRRIVQRARPLGGAPWQTPLLEIADRLGIDTPPRLLRSEDSKMPFACGILRPTIVLPAESDEWSDDRRRAVLLHELGHVRRRDLIGHTLARITCAVYWFHPLVWTAARRMRIESERACDDLAITSGARASEYAEHLLDIVTRVRQQSTPAVAIPMAQRKEFEGRMLAILDPELERKGPNRLQSLSLASGIAVLALVVAAAAPAAPRATPPTAGPGAAQNATPVDPSRDSVANASVSSSVSERSTTRTVQKTDTSFQKSERTNPASDNAGVPVDLNRRAGLAVTPAAPSATMRIQNADSLAGLVKQDQGRSRTGDDRSKLLADLLRSDTSAKLRRVAAWGLQNYADEREPAAALAEAVRRDRSDAVREMAAWALSGAGEHEEGVVSALSEALRRDDNIRVRHTAAWALGNLGSASTADALIDALRDDNADLREVAAWSLGQLGLDKAPRELTAALRDKEPKVRRAVAWALFNIGDENAVSDLETAMDRETEKGLRVAYIRALANMGERSARALAKLLDSKDSDVREIVVTSLAGGHAAGPWPWPWPMPRPFP